MKFSASAVTLLSAAAGVMAAPSTQKASSTVATRDSHRGGFAGFVLPNLIKNHDVVSNLNTKDVQTATVRNGHAETSTLYQIPIPEWLDGKICSLVVSAGRIGKGDNVLGEQAMDIFNNNIADLGALESGNFRNNQLARIRFNAATGLYDFDNVDFNAIIDEFPCPAGRTLEWESVAVGEFDINVIRQDFVDPGFGFPNGLSVAFK